MTWVHILIDIIILLSFFFPISLVFSYCLCLRYHGYFVDFDSDN